MKLPNYIATVLLRHLEQLPEVDLSQSPYSEPKGDSNGKQDEGINGRDHSGQPNGPCTAQVSTGANHRRRARNLKN